MQRRSTSSPDPKVISAGEVGRRFLDVMMYNTQPLVPELSGLEVEYRIVQIYCRDAGRKEASLALRHRAGADPASSRPGRRRRAIRPNTSSSASRPSLVKLGVRDEDGKPTTAAVHHPRRPVAASIPRRAAGSPPTSTFTRRSTARDGETVALAARQATPSPGRAARNTWC